MEDMVSRGLIRTVEKSVQIQFGRGWYELPRVSEAWGENPKLPLKFTATADGKAVFEGVFIDFKLPSGSGQMYDKERVLKVLPELQEKTLKGTVLGEVAPWVDGFSVALSNVSHLVKLVYHDPKRDTINGVFQLLATEPGKVIHKILTSKEFGPHIEARSRVRAAGKIENDLLTPHKIFTFDLDLTLRDDYMIPSTSLVGEQSE